MPRSERVCRTSWSFCRCQPWARGPTETGRTEFCGQRDERCPCLGESAIGKKKGRLLTHIQVKWELESKVYPLLLNLFIRVVLLLGQVSFHLKVNATSLQREVHRFTFMTSIPWRKCPRVRIPSPCLQARAAERLSMAGCWESEGKKMIMFEYEFKRLNRNKLKGGIYVVYSSKKYLIWCFWAVSENRVYMTRLNSNSLLTKFLSNKQAPSFIKDLLFQSFQTSLSDCRFTHGS